MPTPSYATTIAALRTLIAGIEKHPPLAPLVIDGESYTAKQLIATIQSIIDAMTATVAARAVFLEASKKSDAALSDNNPFLRDLRQSLRITYGSRGSILADFALTPRKPRTTSPAVVIAAAAKAKATRTARGTKGKRQRAQISGNVTSVILTPVLTPTESSPVETAPSPPSGAPKD